MDIHRCRFVPYPVSPINALAFSHPPSPGSPAPPSLRLALGRANGDIEIWNPADGRWVQERILRSGKERSVEGLAWTQDPDGRLRLFSIGYSAAITEWDLASSRPLRHSGGNHGEIWCISAQPPQPDSPPKLVAGCADGSLVVFSAAEDELSYSHTLPRPSTRRARALSLAWRSAHTVAAGYSDGCIRLFDVRGRGRALQTLSLGGGGGGRSGDVLVWAVRCLADGSLVSGDSTGEIKVWDAATLALTQRIAGHKADVLDVAASADGSVLVSGGIDRRTVVYRRAPAAVGEVAAKRRWAEVSHQRLHASDVKALASYEADGLAVVVSGGLDATPIVMPLHRHGFENTRRLAAGPNVPPLASAPARRLVASWWEQEVRIWAVGSASEVQTGYDANGERSPAHDLVAKIALQGEDSITSCSLAADASLVAVSTSTRTVLFRLLQRPASQLLKVRKVVAPPAVANTGSSLVSLSPDVNWLFRLRDGTDPQMFRMHWDDETKDGVDVDSSAIRLGRRSPDTQGSEGEDEEQPHARSIHRVAWSDDSRMLVGCDVAGHFDKWVRQDGPAAPARAAPIASSTGSDDELSDDDAPHGTLAPWTRVGPELPHLGSTPLVLAFAPDAPSSGDEPAQPRSTRSHPGAGAASEAQQHKALVAVTHDHQVLEFDALSGRRTPWSRRNPPASLPAEFRAIRERAMGAAWDASGGRRRLWLYGSSWLWMFDLAQDLPAQATGGSQKRKLGDAAGDELRRLMAKTSGAGGRVPARLQDAGVGVAMTTEELDEDELTTQTKLLAHTQAAKTNGAGSGDEMDVDDEDEDAAGAALLQLRRGGEAPEGATALDGGSEDEGAPSNWGTFKYRPILGVVALGGGQSGEYGDDAAGAFEVALVERPPWDAELAQRWEGDQEVER